ncbi:MAG TPA: tetratricopeptide repeat protein [Terriglobales bacterium]|nr:tetratricopeptide repeat protein [Terriglobales bacterium]
MKSRFVSRSIVVLLVSSFLSFSSGYALAQTYDVNQGGSAAPAGQPQNSSADATNGATATTNDAQQNSSGLGWGSSIDVARRARAAQEALQRNDYSAAVTFAEQAAKSAPQNAELWFLLGYADRLAEHYQPSVDAYNRGLQLQPGSVRGLAGLAQTYAKMGRNAEAENLLRRVVDANPKDANSLQLAGELLLTSDAQRSLDLLLRADAIQPTPHAEILIAHAYQQLGKTDDSSRYLTRARNRAPKDPEVLRAVAGQYREQGQYDQAIASLQAIPNKNSDVQAELAYTYQLSGKPQEAADLYVRVAKSAKGNLAFDLSAAQALVNLGQADAARGFLEDARRVDPNNYRLHAILGAIAESEDRTADAGTEYNLALNNLPKHVPEGPLYPVELRLNLYETDVRLEDAAAATHQLDSAAAEINQIQIPSAARPEMLRLRAAIEAASGNLDAANKDLKEALTLAPTNLNSLLNYASLQWKLGQKDAARDTFTRVLDGDPNNRTALSALGYLARDQGDAKLAETYFTRAAKAHPKDFAPYLALGDLYTAEKNLPAAETAYEAAYQRAQTNALIVSGGANAALEAHNFDLAKQWLDRANARTNERPQVERERERYLTLKGDYAESAKLGYAVLEKLPNDREGAVYLAYDLYYLGHYDEALALANKYDSVLANDKDLPLIKGYVHAHNGQSREAFDDFTRALEIDPNMAPGFEARGYVLNDLREPTKASADFRTALRLQPNYGEAHLGLAYADLQLHRPQPALIQLESAQKLLGKSHAYHLARAEAYRQEQNFSKAEPEYRVALDEEPNDLPTRLAYADTLFRLRRYPQSLAEIYLAAKLSSNDPAVFALRAQVHAKLGNREATHQDIQLAEQYGNNKLEILMATGDALLSLGEQDAAMQRFSRALDDPSGDRIGVRLAVAQVFLRQGNFDEARHQIALGFAEAHTGSSSVTADDILAAANIFLAMHDFDLAETYFDKARLAGANPLNISIGLTNTYLAEGKTSKAEEELASLGPADDFRDDYDYMMASANLAWQRQDTVHALSAFAEASTVAGEENNNYETAQLAQYQLADEEGRQINRVVSFLPDASFAPVLEDINVYTLDARISPVANPSLLPPPRHSFQSMAESHYRIHVGDLPPISGFVGESLTDGTLLFPSVNVIQTRHTFDTFFNGGIAPTLHFGSNSITFNGGIQFTVRRDTVSPVYMSQNLFKQFLYMSTNSFFNWLSVTGSAVREAGPFIDQDLHSRDASANIEFTVGRPWGSTSLITGYSVRDLLFRPAIREYFNTASYIGLQHKFGNRITAAILAEDLRSWQVSGPYYVTAQALLPGARFDFRVNQRWSAQGSFVLSRGMGFHEYDNAQSEFLISYVRPVRGSLKDGTADVPVSYPIRLSFGVQQQTFYDFAGSSRSTILPIVRFTLF